MFELLLPAAIGSYIGYRFGQTRLGVCCCCLTSAIVGIWYYEHHNSQVSEKPDRHPVNQVAPEIRNQNSRELPTIIDPERMEDYYPKTNSELEKAVDEDSQQSRSKSFLLRQIENYQKNISPRLHEDLKTERICRYTPSCSEYAKQAIEKYGPTKGMAMAASRLLRCNPLSKGGDDPVT